MWDLRFTKALWQDKHLVTSSDSCFLFLAEGLRPVFDTFVLGASLGKFAVLTKGSLTVSLILLDDDGSICLMLTLQLLKEKCCSIGGCWFGACGYADDLIILAPNREVLQRMLDICDAYASDHNLIFSTDPVPARSKTKCIYFCGRPGQVTYPQPVQLGGKDLPWVESADHLGHCISQMTNMEKDCQRARAIFIRKTLEIREQFSFANPENIMQAVQIFCTYAYGSMLWDLSSNTAEQYFKSWNTCVKLVHGLPRNTFTYLVEGFLSGSQASLRNQVLSRYPGFYRGLLNSPSKEVRILARMVSRDPRSTTNRNLKYLEQKTNLKNPEFCSSWKVRDALPVQNVPEKEKWRLGLISTLMKVKKEKYLEVENMQNICAMLDSLAST